MNRFSEKLLKMTLAGIMVGILVGVFQIICMQAISLSTFLLQENAYTQVLFFVLVIIFALISLMIVKIVPSVSGSGIPQIELNVRGKYEIKPIRTIFAMMANCLLSMFSGLSLGSEGPSVEIAGCTGQVVNKVFKSDERDIVVMSSACGFSCAFLAPIAGFFYAFEEIAHKWNPRYIFQLVYIILLSYYTTLLINAHAPIKLEIYEYMPIECYYVFIFVIIFATSFSYIFVKCLVYLKDTFKKVVFRPFMYRGVLVFVLAGIIALFFHDFSGSGLILLDSVKDNRILEVVFLLLIFKIIFTIVCANTPCSGGLLIPMLCIGAVFGYFISLASHTLFGLDLQHTDLIMLVSMLSFFTAVTKSKYTALGLAVSFGTFHLVIIPAIITIIGTFYLSKLTKQDNIYEYLMERVETPIEETKE